MTKLFNRLSIIGLSAAMLAASILPSQAAMPIAAAPQVEKDVVQVQYWRDGPRGGHWRGDGYRGGGYYGGHRGYRDYRPGYRRHNGYWFPLAAFGAGALIGGAIAAQPRYVEPAPARSGINPRHYEYCAGRYRSYDSYSNTFQPYSGPRQTCVSPYY
jgi:hypothetical protein